MFSKNFGSELVDSWINNIWNTNGDHGGTYKVENVGIVLTTSDTSGVRVADDIYARPIVNDKVGGLIAKDINKTYTGYWDLIQDLNRAAGSIETYLEREVAKFMRKEFNAA